MKRQKYVNSLDKGSILFNVSCWVSEGGKRHVDLEEWHITTIQASRGMAKWASDTFIPTKYVNLRLKSLYLTCDRDGNWLKSIPKHYRRQFKQGDDLPAGFYTTKLKALQYAIKDCEESVQWYNDEIKDPENADCIDVSVEELEDYKVLLRMTKSRLTKFKRTGE